MHLSTVQKKDLVLVDLGPVGPIRVVAVMVHLHPVDPYSIVPVQVDPDPVGNSSCSGSG